MSFLTGVTNYLSQNKKPLTALLSLSNIKANYSHNSPFQYKNKFTLRAPDKQPPNEVMRRTVHGRILYFYYIFIIKKKKKKKKKKIIIIIIVKAIIKNINILKI